MRSVGGWAGQLRPGGARGEGAALMLGFMAIMGQRVARAPTLDDEAGLRAAYAAHGPELYRFALRALGDAGAAEEVVQDTFVRAWRAADRYDPSLSSVRVWLFAIIRNAVIDHARVMRTRPWHRQVIDLGDEPDAGTAIGDRTDEVLHAWLVTEALRRLTEDHRQVIVETYLRDRSHEEVAAELGVPPGTLRSRLFYGLKALRVALDEMGVTP